MLTDVHSICGYLVGKWLFFNYFPTPEVLEQFLVRLNATTPSPFAFPSLSHGLDRTLISISNLFEALVPPFSLPVAFYSLPIPYLSTLLSSARTEILPSDILSFNISLWHSQPTEWLYYCRFIFASVLLANAPDIDICFASFFGGHHNFHRSVTHSIISSTALSGVYTVLVSMFLGLSLPKSFVLCSASMATHLFTDFITNYGTKLLWPVDLTAWTMGSVTVMDASSIILFYLFFYLTFNNYISPTSSVLATFSVISAYAIWRRGLLYEAIKKAETPTRFDAFQRIPLPTSTPSSALANATIVSSPTTPAAGQLSTTVSLIPMQDSSSTKPLPTGPPPSAPFHLH
eukprot:TRINITY_DN4102_c0_g1_i1.p1 TRINITY_DN4102_c0_g1~~TRINITY_DN4102_c0_g1_i1.p1  ORF type:complete len:345 (+),score=55.68 TRINITY_DN4102_c0_g1_i1:225-1259(+)